MGKTFCLPSELANRRITSASSRGVTTLQEKAFDSQEPNGVLTDRYLANYITHLDDVASLREVERIVLVITVNLHAHHAYTRHIIDCQLFVLSTNHMQHVTNNRD